MDVVDEVETSALVSLASSPLVSSSIFSTGGVAVDSVWPPDWSLTGIGETMELSCSSDRISVSESPISSSGVSYTESASSM